MPVQQLPNCDAICKAVEIKSPTHRQFRGWRLIAVKPNMEATHPRTEERCVSFHPRFQLWVNGDFQKFPSQHQISAFEEVLTSTHMNIKKIHWISD